MQPASATVLHRWSCALGVLLSLTYFCVVVVVVVVAAVDVSKTGINETLITCLSSAGRFAHIASLADVHEHVQVSPGVLFVRSGILLIGH